MPTKGVGLRRAISKKYDVALVDEFRTSKLCNRCHGELKNYRRIHRLLVCQCKSDGLESKNITFINRDINACMNILYLSQNWINSKSRPKAFSRSSSLDPDPHVRVDIKNGKTLVN